MQSFPLAPEPASNFATNVDLLMYYVIAVCAFVAGGITIAIVYFFFRYRRRHEAEVGVPIHGDMRLETAWITIFPFRRVA